MDKITVYQSGDSRTHRCLKLHAPRKTMSTSLRFGFYIGGRGLSEVEKPHPAASTWPPERIYKNMESSNKKER